MAALLAASLLAAAPAAPAPPPGPHWRVDWGEPRCVLSREGGPNDPSFAVRFVPAERRAEIWIIDPRWRRLSFGETGNIKLVLDPPDGDSVESFIFAPIGATGRYALASERAGEDFLDRLSKAQAVSLRRKGVEILRFPLPGSAIAVAGARQCEDDMLGRWGVDPAAFRALKERPRPIAMGNWLYSGDYPEAALRTTTTGTTAARVDVDATGRVTGCSVVVSSGSKDLDDATCTAALRRGRFAPAVGADGRKVRALTILSVRWSIRG